MTQEGEEKVDTTSQAGPGAANDGGTGTTGVIRRPLTRSRSSRMLGGVTGGLGEYAGVDPILFRLGFALLTFLGGAGIALYAAAWILIPLEGQAQSAGEVGLARASRYVSEERHSWVWITALVVGGLILISNLGHMGFDDGAFLWAAILIAGGIWLYRQDSNSGSMAEAASPPVPPDPLPSPGGSTATATKATYVARPAAPRTPAVPKPPPSRLGRYTFAITLVGLGIAALLDNAGAIDVSGPEYAAVALTTVGIGLLVGSVMGRARGLILWGLLLVPVVLVGSDADLPVRDGIGGRVYIPVSSGDLAGQRSLFAGNLRFDLSDMEWGNEPAEIDASVFVGQIEIFVPEGVDVSFRGYAEMGMVEFFDQTREGENVFLNAVENAGDGPELIIDARVHMGQVVVGRTGISAKELS